jgi:hypothetical protein
MLAVAVLAPTRHPSVRREPYPTWPEKARVTAAVRLETPSLS